MYACNLTEANISTNLGVLQLLSAVEMFTQYFVLVLLSYLFSNHLIPVENAPSSSYTWTENYKSKRHDLSCI